MERILLALVCLSGGNISCLQFYYVAEPKKWTEAQTYCRQTYTDLATLGSADDANQLFDTVASAGGNSDFWIGRYAEIDWRWSDGFNGSGADYRNWKPALKEPVFTGGPQCIVTLNGDWSPIKCSAGRQFVCYKGSQNKRRFVHLRLRRKWPEARRHCRENYIDLATVTNKHENTQVHNFLPNKDLWIGLFRDVQFYWSDGSNFTHSHLPVPASPIESKKVLCGVTSLHNNGSWRFLSCDSSFPFVCYGPPKPAITKQLLKLKVTLKDSSVDLNHPAVRAQLLEKLQDRLKKNNVTGVSLQWRGGPDGKVFHQGEEGSQETQGEKDEP